MVLDFFFIATTTNYCKLKTAENTFYRLEVWYRSQQTKIKMIGMTVIFSRGSVGKTCFFTNLGWCRRSSIFLLSTKGHFQFPETMYIPALMALSLNLQSVTVSWVSFSQCKTPLLLFLCHLSFSLRVATYSSLLLRTQVIILGEPSNLG